MFLSVGLSEENDSIKSAWGMKGYGKLMRNGDG